MSDRSSVGTSSGREEQGGFWELLRTIGFALLIAMAIRTVLVEPFRIPSGSMIPTLLVGDYLFVSKFSYGYSRHSFPLSAGMFSGRILDREPQRGDVAVFKLPLDNHTDYIKRVIGLPGDRIQMKFGHLYINDKEVPRKLVGEYVYRRGNGMSVRGTQYIETLPNGREHRIIEINDTGDLDDTEVYTVPVGHYFMMGDNRDDSQDSRVLRAVGYVPYENLIGPAQFLFLSVDGDLWKFWEWPDSFRFSRLFNSVD